MATGYEGPTGFKRTWEAIAGVFKFGSGTGGVLIVPNHVDQSLGLYAALAKERGASPVIKGRAAQTGAKLAVYDNELAEQVLGKLRAAFHPENYARMQFVVHLGTNVLRRLVDDVSIL